MDKYRYIATRREYLDYCMELIALRAISREDHYYVGQTGFGFYKVTYGWFESTLKDILPRFKEKYKIDITPPKLLEIMDGAKDSYRHFAGDLDGYLQSVVIKEFQSICLGNQLGNVELLDFWVELFGRNLTGLRMIGKRDNVDYGCNVPSIFNINDIANFTNKNFFADYYGHPSELNRIVKSEFPSTFIRFIPSKYTSLLHMYLWITENGHLYPTILEKHTSIFTLLECIFGELSDNKQLLRMLLFVFHNPVQHFIHYKDQYNCTKENFWTKNDLENFLGDKEFSDEALRSLKVYRSRLGRAN